MPGFSEPDSDSSDDEESLLPSPNEESSSTTRTVGILEGNEIDEILEEEEALDTIDGPPLSPIKSRKSIDDGRSRRNSVTRLERRMSSPIGMRGSIGPGGRRLSNGLAASNMGQGTGGNTFQ